MMPGTPQQILGNLGQGTSQPQPSYSQPPVQKPVFNLPGRDEEEDDDSDFGAGGSDFRPQLPAVPDRMGAPTIPLGVLLDFAVQQIYHEVTVLSELLPKKQDADKKITLVQFAHTTRMLFVKLLAVVKWLKTSKKFEQCASINYFLDNQIRSFAETADTMFELARSKLLLARVPKFEIMAAVDVLLLGKYPNLPRCIKARFIREPKITDREQEHVLERLDQVLKYRVALASTKLSPRISKIVIRNGMARFTVAGEFEATLTVLGESSKNRWTVLSVKCLVNDYEIGFGSQLVHPDQMNMMHEILQHRMDRAVEPLVEMFSYLHSMAQMVQLDTLYCQANTMIQDRLANKISIEKYDPKERLLTIGYWLTLETGKRAVGQGVKYTPQYRMQIYGDPHDHNSPLKVRHMPVGPEFDWIDARSGRLSMIELLAQALTARCQNRLLRIRKRIQAAEPKALLVKSGMAAPGLHYVILADSAVPAPNPTEDETIAITINMFSGRILCRLPALGTNNHEIIREFETALYSGRTTSEMLREKVHNIRVLLLLERYKKAISVLQGVRLINERQMQGMFEKMPDFPSKDRICLQFLKEEAFFLIVCFLKDRDIMISTRLFLVETPSLSTVELNDGDRYLPDMMVAYMKRLSVDGTNKQQYLPPAQRNHYTSWERPLVSAIAAIDDRIAFNKVADELRSKGIKFEDPSVERIVGGLVLKIMDISELLPTSAFFDSLSRCCVRMDSKSRLAWPFECCIPNIPLIPDLLPSKKASRMAAIVQELTPSSPQNTTNVADQIIERLQTFSAMYDVVSKFTESYKTTYNKDCSVLHFMYHKLVMAYGPRRDKLFFLNYKPKHPANNRLMIQFGQCYPVDHHDRKNNLPASVDMPQWNAHVIMTAIINDRINDDWDLTDLVHYLVHTEAPLQALNNFFRFRFESQKVTAQIMGLDTYFPIWLKCHLIPVSETTVRLLYGHIHLEFTFSEEEKVFVRDVSGGGPRAAGLSSFYRLLQEDDMLEVHDEMPTREKRAPSPRGGPKSCATLLGLNVPSPAVSSRLSRSVPAMNQGSPLVSAHEEATLSESLKMMSSCFSISCATHVKACQPENEGPGFFTDLRSSRLDDYLHALCSIARMGNAFEAYRLENNRVPYVVFTHLSFNVEQVRATLATTTGGSVLYNIHLCPDAMRLRIKIEYANEKEMPSDSDIATMCSYFEKLVGRMNNEIAVMAFFNLCRVTSHNAASDFATLMHAQMEPPPHLHYNISLSLTTLQGVRDQAPIATSSRKFACGAIVDLTNTAIAFAVCFRPNSRNRLREKHALRVMYNLQMNVVKPANKQTFDLRIEGETMEAMMERISNSAKAPPGFCPVWPAMKLLLERSGEATVGALPASVPASIGPGSVNPPGSNASMRM